MGSSPFHRTWRLRKRDATQPKGKHPAFFNAFASAPKHRSKRPHQPKKKTRNVLSQSHLPNTPRHRTARIRPSKWHQPRTETDPYVRPSRYPVGLRCVKKAPQIRVARRHPVDVPRRHRPPRLARAPSQSLVVVVAASQRAAQRTGTGGASRTKAARKPAGGRRLSAAVTGKQTLKHIAYAYGVFFLLQRDTLCGTAS